MSEFEKFNPCCSYEPPSNFYDGYTGFEILNKLIKMINDFIDYINSLQSQLDAKEDSENITNNRKLSETGNFTGTWFGETFQEMKLKDGNFTGTWFNDTKTNMDAKDELSLTLYQQVIDLLNGNPEYGITVVDGGFYASPDAPTIIDNGNYTDPVTGGIDNGNYTFNCNCSN